MAGYVLFHYNITDRSKIDELSELSQPIHKKYNAEVIVGSPVKAVEGEALTHMVMLKFESFEAAQTFYNSPEQKELTKFRNRITQGWAAIVPGDSETQAVIDSGYYKK